MQKWAHCILLYSSQSILGSEAIFHKALISVKLSGDVLPVEFETGNSQEGSAKLYELLRALGDDGWELVTATEIIELQPPLASEKEKTLYFKRPVP